MPDIVGVIVCQTFSRVLETVQGDIVSSDVVQFCAIFRNHTAKYVCF